MKLPDIKDVTTADEAQNLAIEWSNWEPEPYLTLSELDEWNDFFRQCADKFPELKDEFEENGII